MSEPKKILFFDGDCGLCQRSVRFLMKRGKRKQIYFAPLQGETAIQLLPERYRAELDTVVYRLPDGECLTRFSAITRYLIDSESFLSFPAKLLNFLPRVLLDRLYNLIAQRRHRLTPAKTCLLDEKHTSGRILP
ncbi:MAG: thiol-disulfide oxidoreductase DCC family protein [Coraliomargaritaceae bacterium]